MKINYLLDFCQGLSYHSSMGDVRYRIGALERMASCYRPLFGATVSAGFPSPADDYIERPLDLNEHLITNPPATFFVRVSGQSMKDAGIHDGDLLIVERSLTPVDGSVVIASIFGELTVKRIRKRGNQLFLVPDNNAYEPIEISSEMELNIWGVCKHVIHGL